MLTEEEEERRGEEEGRRIGEEEEEKDDEEAYLGLQKKLYWMSRGKRNMTAPWMDMAHRFLPTMSQPRGSLKRSSPVGGK